MIECFVKPNGAGARPTCLRPRRAFRVLKGSLTLKLDGEELPRGPATGSSSGRNEAPFCERRRRGGALVCEVRPALSSEQLIETRFSLAADGKTNNKGMPNPLGSPVIARDTFDTVQLAFPPTWMQRMGLVFAAPLGRRSATSRPTDDSGAGESEAVTA